MKITDIPSSTIDLITKLNCHEFSMGETISPLTASELKAELENHLLWLSDNTLIDNDADAKIGDITISDIYSEIHNLIEIVSELEDETIDRLAMSLKYREAYNNFIDMIFSEKTFDELDEEEVEHLNFIPTSDGWVLPVCFRNIYGDDLIVHHRYTDEEKKFGDISYTEHDGVLFDYYYKMNEV